MPGKYKSIVLFDYKFFLLFNCTVFMLNYWKNEIISVTIRCHSRVNSANAQKGYLRRIFIRKAQMLRYGCPAGEKLPAIGHRSN